MNWFNRIRVRKLSGGPIVLFMVFLSMLTLGLVDSARGPLYPKVVDYFHLTHTNASRFFWSSSIASVCNNMLAFYWLKRWGALQGLRGFMVLHLVAQLILAVSGNFNGVTIGVVFLGIAMGGMGITQNLLVGIVSTARFRRQALSGLHAMYGISALIAPQIVNLYVGDGIGVGSGLGVYLWLAAISALVIGLSLFCHLPDAAANHRGLTFHLEGPHRRSIQKYTLSFALTLTFYTMAELAISTRLVNFAQEVAKEDYWKANWWLTGFFICLTGGRSVFALVPLPFSHRQVLVVSALATLVMCSLGLFLESTPLLAASGLGMSVFYPCMFAWMSDSRGDFAGYIASWSIAVQGFGVTLMHVGVGLLSDSLGVGQALWIAPICMLISLLLLGNRRLSSGERATSL